jgi:hypothetical protein
MGVRLLARLGFGCVGRSTDGMWVRYDRSHSYSPEAVFILTDGKCHDVQLVCEYLERMTQEGGGPSYLVLVGLEADVVGRRNLRDIARSFGLWVTDPPELPESTPRAHKG